MLWWVFMEMPRILRIMLDLPARTRANGHCMLAQLCQTKVRPKIYPIFIVLNERRKFGLRWITLLLMTSSGARKLILAEFNGFSGIKEKHYFGWTALAFSLQLDVILCKKDDEFKNRIRIVSKLSPLPLWRHQSESFENFRIF